MRAPATVITAINEMVPIAYMVLNTIGTVTKIEYGPNEAEITVQLRQDDPPDRATIEVSVRTDGVDFRMVAV